MRRTRQTEQIANYCLVLSAKGLEKHYQNKEQKEQGDDNEIQDAGGDNDAATIAICTRGVSKGIIKLVNMEHHVLYLENEYAKTKKNTREEFKSKLMFVSQI